MKGGITFGEGVRDPGFHPLGLLLRDERPDEGVLLPWVPALQLLHGADQLCLDLVVVILVPSPLSASASHVKTSTATPLG